jgi:hypothetical protein
MLEVVVTLDICHTSRVGQRGIRQGDMLSVTTDSSIARGSGHTPYVMLTVESVGEGKGITIR